VKRWRVRFGFAHVQQAGRLGDGTKKIDEFKGGDMSVVIHQGPMSARRLKRIRQITPAVSGVTALCLLGFGLVTVAAAQETEFAQPELLRVDGQPMNADGKMMYPSPVVFDIDGDGNDELVIGTIFGAVYACENSNKGPGDPQWQAPQSVNTDDGKPLKLNNW